MTVPSIQAGQRTSQILLSSYLPFLFNWKNDMLQSSGMSSLQDFQRLFVSLLISGFSFFQESRDCYWTQFAVLISSLWFCDSYRLNSSREVRAGNSSTGMQKNYLSTSWRRRHGNGSSRRAGLSKQIQGSVKWKVEREGKGLENVAC